MAGSLNHCQNHVEKFFSCRKAPESFASLNGMKDKDKSFFFGPQQ
jgi:hypothetical protein